MIFSRINILPFFIASSIIFPCLSTDEQLDVYVQDPSTKKTQKVFIPKKEINTTTMADIKKKYAEIKNITNTKSFDFSVKGSVFVTENDYAKNLEEAEVIHGLSKNIIFVHPSYAITVKTHDEKEQKIRTIEKKTTVKQLKKICQSFNIEPSNIRSFIVQKEDQTTTYRLDSDDDTIDLEGCQVDPYARKENYNVDANTGQRGSLYSLFLPMVAAVTITAYYVHNLIKPRKKTLTKNT